jgi:hypothetical protein
VKALEPNDSFAWSKGIAGLLRILSSHRESLRLDDMIKEGYVYFVEDETAIRPNLVSNIILCSSTTLKINP